MGFKTAFILLAFLACVVSAAWEPVERIDENCTTEMKRASLYINQITRITHYFWCQLDVQSGRYYLYYRRQIPEGILYPETILDISHSCEGVAATGSNDGTRIYVAYSAERSRSRTSCNDEMTDGCMDIYTLESSDGGETWSVPEVLPRRNTSDVRDRWNPRIITNPLSERVWIFYLTQEKNENLYSIGYISKPDKSSPYGPEVLVNTRKEIIVDVAVAVSNLGRLCLHLVWSGDVEGKIAMYQAISTNNGRSWSDVGFVDRGFSGNMVSDIIMNDRQMYIGHLKGTGLPTYLKISRNGGERWRPLQISALSGLPDISLCYKSFGTDGAVFALLNVKLGTGDYKGEFGYYLIASERWVQSEKPFGNFILDFDPNARCYVENGQYIVKAIAISKNTELYMTKNVIS